MPSKKCLEHIAKRLAEKENGRKKKKKKEKKPLTEEQKLKKEMRRRAKISKTMRKKIKDKIEKARRDGYRAYLKRKRAEIKEREKEKEREKKRLKKEKELLKKQKNKKKPGRHKKPGPKPKRKKKLPPKEPKLKVTYNYKIISCRNGIQNKYVGKYKTIQDAYDVFNELKEHSNPEFPALISNDGAIENSIDEYVMIEKSDEENSLLRNEYGKLVEQKTNLDGWIIIDKFRYYKEETFSVFDYNFRTERKTFSWIYDNIVLDGIDTKFDFKRIIMYKNKIIVKDDNDYIDLIICKCYSDSIRFYNLLQEKTKKDKNKQILFLGDVGSLGPHDEKRTKIESEIQERTGWPLSKVRLKATSKLRKKGEK